MLFDEICVLVLKSWLNESVYSAVWMLILSLPIVNGNDLNVLLQSSLRKKSLSMAELQDQFEEILSDAEPIVIQDEIQTEVAIDLENLEMENSKTIFQSLLYIFPDADHQYLEQISLDYSLQPTNLNSFVEGLLKSKNYPKKKTDPEVIAVEPVDSTHRNSVEEFLKKFEDPVKYFSQRNVGFEFSPYSQNYLRDKFKFVGVRTIRQVLAKTNSNLTLTYEGLLKLEPDRCTKRSKLEILPYLDCPDERFHDEIYFLDHKDELVQLIKTKENLMKLRLEEAKLKNELLECQCCYNDELFSTDVLTCMEGHIFCKNCVKRSVEIAFGDGKIKFDCLFECDSEFKIETLEGILTDAMYKKIHLKIQESEIKSADISGICFCPYCEYAEIPDENERVFKCKICKKESCRFCQAESHIPLSCKEYSNAKSKNSARIQIEDKMTEALLRECYKCKKKFIKQDGCNKMQCICGALMCYICRQPVKDYSHFSDNRELIIQPSTSKQTTKCPLWSNNNQLHLDAVVEAAKIASANRKR